MDSEAVPLVDPDGLSETSVDPDPFRQFATWFAEAQTAGELLPEAMTLATATLDGQPSARMVLLRGFDDRGFGFFTDYASQKGRELAQNPVAALVLYWSILGRQVRMTGSVVKQSAEESSRYFHRRPVASQLSALVSRQSQVVASRALLEQGVAALAQRHAGEEVPLPPTWGGYRLMPNAIEFWLHRENRLHDRVRYTRRDDQGWLIERLSP